MDTPLDEHAELLVRDIARRWLQPQPRECLACYVWRMLEEFGCAGTLRFAAGFRDARMPRARALERRLQNAGGFCDCEVLHNAVREAVTFPDDARPVCRGVTPRTIQPCALWRTRGW